MSKLQRVFKTNTLFTIKGPSGLSRQLWFINVMKIGWQEYLVFQPLRKVTKVRKKKRTRPSLSLVKKRA